MFKGRAILSEYYFFINEIEGEQFAGEKEVDVVDTTAAGDTFTGYFLSYIICGKPVKEGLYIATKASAIAVSRPGATSSIPRLEEVLSYKID